MTTSTINVKSSLDAHVSNLFDVSLGITPAKTKIDSQSSDSDIIQSIIKGSRDNFSLLVERYYRPIFNYLLRSLNFHTENSQDLTSETFFKAYLNLNRYRNNTRFSSWLYKIAHNNLIDYYRAYQGTFEEVDTINDDPSSRQIASRLSKDILDVTVTSEEILAPVLNSLSSEDRQLLQLFYVEDLSVQEIASVFDVFPGTIKTRLHRARNKAKSIILKNTDDQAHTFLEKIESFMSNVSSVFNSAAQPDRTNHN